MLFLKLTSVVLKSVELFSSHTCDGFFQPCNYELFYDTSENNRKTSRFIVKCYFYCVL